MHKLTRTIRFTLYPFNGSEEGFNSYSSRPSGAGMGIFIALDVEVEGEVDNDTGFVINLVDIDTIARKTSIPIFVEAFQKRIAEGKNISLPYYCNILKQCFNKLERQFKRQSLTRLALMVNPYKKVTIFKEGKMLLYSEKFEFAATHKLWNDNFTEAENFHHFGKCANPAGHGHNYIVEVTVGLEKPKEFEATSFQQAVKDVFIDRLDHKNLSVDVPYFKENNPTVENITSYCWDLLIGKFTGASLYSITIWENDRAYCTYSGEGR